MESYENQICEEIEVEEEKDERQQIISSKTNKFIDITDEKYKKPFEFGWKRELVYQSSSTSDPIKTDKADVYYISPTGKKVRTKMEIQEQLDDHLDVNMFTFTKRALGASEDDEVVRSANQRGVKKRLVSVESDSVTPVRNTNLINSDCNWKTMSQRCIDFDNGEPQEKNQMPSQLMEVISKMDVSQLRISLIEKENLIEDLKLSLVQKEVVIRDLRRKIQTNIPSTEDLQVEIAKSFPMFTENQIALMTKKKKRVNWTFDEISNGFAFSYFNRKSYNHAINVLHYAHPSIRTLQKWGEKIRIEPGILRDCLVVLKGMRSTLTEGQSPVIVAYDEMKCKSVYQYNPTLDSIMGPNSQMQTAMVRGLFAKFKQPIYINFDEKMTPELLDSLSTELYKIGYTVVGFVGDNGGGNVGLWSNCNVDFENNTIKHPVTGDTIFMFSDVPHLLKLLRNWFLDGGFLLPDKTFLNQQKIRELLKTNTEISPIFKLSLKHLEVRGAERQNVRMAAELFSHTVAESLRRNFPLDKEVEKLANFVELVNKWFDISNSYSVNGIGYKKPYGGLDEQNAVLDEMYLTVKTMKCYSKKHELLQYLQIFQKGILMSIRSLKGLFLEMKEKFRYQYILTHRANQDCLENFFSQQRFKNGPNDHPTPVECLNNTKTIILGKNPGLSKDLHTNTVERDPEQYASATFYNRLLSDDNSNERETDAEGIISLESEPKNSMETDAAVDISLYEIPDEFIADLDNSMPIDDQSKRMERSTEDGLEYIAGWIAFKFKEQNPCYSQSKRECLPSHISDHTYAQRQFTSRSWIDAVSYGGLTKPNEQVLNWVKAMEAEFQKIHGSMFNYRLNVKANLIVSLQENCSQVPTLVIKLFAKLRIFMRCKYLNKKITEDALLKTIENRRLKAIKRRIDESEDSSRAKNKKMKKIVN